MPRTSAPLRGTLLAWSAIGLWCLYWAAEESLRSLSRESGERTTPFLAAEDIPIVALGGILTLAAGIACLVRPPRARVRPRASLVPVSARAASAGLLFGLATWVLGYAGIALWTGPLTLLLSDFHEAAVAIVWPALRGAPWRKVRAALGLVRGAGLRTEIALGVLAYPVSLSLAFAWSWLASPPPSPEHEVYNWLGDPSPFVRACAQVSVLVAGPWAEEVVFRGAVYRFLRDASARLPAAAGIAFAVTASSFVFAVCHLQGWGAVPALMIFGIVAALLREWRGSLIAPMAFHSAAWAHLLVLFVAGS